VRGLAVVVLVAACSGCGALEAKIGDIEKTALVASVTASVDAKLQERGLSIATLKSALDPVGDGKLTTQGVTQSVTSMAKELALTEAKKIVDVKVQELEVRSATERDNLATGIFLKTGVALLGLVSAYLGKQVVSAQSAGAAAVNHEARVSTIETALNMIAPKPPNV